MNDNESGRGELLDCGPKLHDDLRLVGRAVKQRWPIPDRLKQRILDRLDAIVSENPDDEIAIKAAGQIRQMEQQNQRDEQTAVLHTDRNRFLAIAERLGLNRSPTAIPKVGSAGDSGIIDGTVTSR